MANEITLSGTLTFLKASIGSSLSETDLTFDVSGTDYFQGSQTVSTTEAALKLGDITTPGYCFMKNTDSTNYVSVRSGTGGTNFLKLKAGEFAVFRFEPTAPFVISNTASCIINYLLIED